MEGNTTQSSCTKKTIQQDMPPHPAALLKNNGQLLNELLAIENDKGFSQDLLTAEKTLHLFFSNHSPDKLIQLYNKETLKLAFLIAYRPVEKNKLFSLLKDNDNPHELEKIITHNPYLLNAYDPDHVNPLHRAVQLERKKCITTLLLLNANPNCVDKRGCSPLHRAIGYDVSIDIIKGLLAAGAKPDLMNYKNKTPFDMACEKHSPNVEAFEKYGYLFFSTLWPYKNPFELLKNEGEYLNELANQPIGSPEWELTATALHKLFTNIDMNNVSPEGKIATHTHGYTLFHANRKQCEQLLGEESLTDALNIIIQKKSIKNCLLSATFNNDYKTIEHILKNYSVSAALQYELLTMCIKDNNMTCLSLYLNNGFSPNRYHKGLSLLYYAIEYERPDAIPLLSDHNADLLPLNNQGQTPLAFAMYLNDQQCIKKMIAAIKNRRILLVTTRGTCGLVQHILEDFSTGCCEKCISELGLQLNCYDFS